MREKGILHWWRNGIQVNLPEGYIVVSMSSATQEKTSIEVSTIPSLPGKRLLVSIVEHIEALITEWFHGLRDDIVYRLIPCIICAEKGLDKPHIFKLEECLERSRSSCSVECPRHKDVPVPLNDIAPDISLQDVHPDLLFEHHELHYDEKNIIKEGSFGKVYRAVLEHASRPSKIVAVKEYKGDELASFRELRKEVNVLKRITHPNLIQMIGVSHNPWCMAFEMADYGSLADILFDAHSQVIIPRLLVVAIAREIVSALSVLHEHKIIHRDLKPANVLIFSLKEDDEVHVKVSDFGTANFAGPWGMRAHVVRTHMRAPEVLEFTLQEEYGIEVDIYCFGILLYGMISRKMPFDATSSNEIRRVVLQQKRPSWRGVDGAMSELVNLTRLMCVSWSQNSRDRPTAKQCKQQLEHAGYQALMSKLAFPPRTVVYFVHFVSWKCELWVLHLTDSFPMLSVIANGLRSNVLHSFVLSANDLKVEGACASPDKMVVLTRQEKSNVLTFHVYSFGDSSLLLSVECNGASLPAVNNIAISSTTVFIATDLGCFTADLDVNVNGFTSVHHLTRHYVHSVMVSGDKCWLLNRDGLVVYSILLNCLSEPLYDADTFLIEGVAQIRSSCLEKDTVWVLTCNAFLELNQHGHELRRVPLAHPGVITCFLCTHDIIWVGLSTGGIMILDADTGRVITEFRPYFDAVSSLVASPDTNPPMVISCGRHPRGCLGSEDTVILPLAIDTSEMIKLVSHKNVSRKLSNKLSMDKFDSSWENQNDVSEVLLAWQALPSRAWKRITAN